MQPLGRKGCRRKPVPEAKGTRLHRGSGDRHRLETRSCRPGFDHRPVVFADDYGMKDSLAAEVQSVTSEKGVAQIHHPSVRGADSRSVAGGLNQGAVAFQDGSVGIELVRAPESAGTGRTDFVIAPRAAAVEGGIKDVVVVAALEYNLSFHALVNRISEQGERLPGQPQSILRQRGGQKLYMPVIQAISLPCNISRAFVLEHE